MHTQFLIVIKYTSGEFRDKMWPVFRLTVVMVVLLSAGPPSGALYPPGQYIDVFQQQQILVYLLKMEVNLLKQQTSQQQQEIDQLKPLQEKVTLLETILGVNLTVDGANLTADGQPSIMERLATVEQHQQAILTQQETFQQQHELYNGSIQSLNDQLESLEADVNLNTENITGIHATLAIHAKHGDKLDEQEMVLKGLADQLLNQSEQLLSLLDKVQLQANTIGGPLNDSSATLVNSLAKIQVTLAEYKTELVLKGVQLEDFERELGNHADQLEQLNIDTQEIPDIKDRVTSLEDALQLLNQTKQVAFSARYSMCGDVDLGENGVVKYDVVETNIGDGYSPDTGCFTAADSGLYIFFTSLRSTNNHGYVTLGIFQGDRNLMEATADGQVHPWNRGSALVTTRLDVGDEVCVKHAGGWTFIDTNNFTTFSGWRAGADH